MPYALEITREDSPAPAERLSLSDLLLLPLLLLALMFQRFSQHLASLKQMRRSRPMPKAWQIHYPDLRASEWAIRMFHHEGARQILCGEELNLRAISFDLDPPDSFQPPM